MDTKTARSTSTGTLIFLYDLHTKLFTNVLVDISEKDSGNRMNTKANHIAWLTGSLVQERYDLANMLGIDMKQTSYELFKDHKGIQDNVAYPTLSEFKKDWEKISPELRNALINATDEKLDEPFEMPGYKMTILDFVCFCVDRESYCIGQIGLWRRLLGYEAMKYD